MAFHGGFSLELRARGDLQVDFHHTVEDTGLALGEAFRSVIDAHGPVERFAHAVVPMDEALSAVTMDACGRPAAVFSGVFPQSRAGDFDVALLRDFFQAFANSSKSAVHASCEYGENSHHMAEALFKAFGMALRLAYRRAEKVRSTKGQA
jgi:imidazoleglycerol-phosphate dehydratase